MSLHVAVAQFPLLLDQFYFVMCSPILYFTMLMLETPTHIKAALNVCHLFSRRVTLLANVNLSIVWLVGK